MKEHGGLVWASFAPDADPKLIPHLPAPGDTPGTRLIRGQPLVWETSAGRHLENILDLAHFPFVHPTTFGCKEAESVQPHSAIIDGDSVRCDVQVITKNPEVPGGGRLYPGLGELITLGYHYTIRIPYRVTIEFDFPDGMTRALHEVVTPISSNRCAIYWLLLVDERLTSSDDDEVAFAQKVFSEDQPIIESQPPGVPLARRAEVHVPADRLAVAYRQALREAGMPEEALV